MHLRKCCAPMPISWDNNWSPQQFFCHLYWHSHSFSTLYTLRVEVKIKAVICWLLATPSLNGIFCLVGVVPAQQNCWSTQPVPHSSLEASLSCVNTTGSTFLPGSKSFLFGLGLGCWFLSSQQPGQKEGIHPKSVTHAGGQLVSWNRSLCNSHELSSKKKDFYSWLNQHPEL